jgi:hypothetical protein
VGHHDTIDHHLLSNEAAALYIADTVQAWSVDQFIPNYADTTSDHCPVLSRYRSGHRGCSGRRVRR